MLRSLDEPIPEPVLPAGFQVRAVARRARRQNAPPPSTRCGSPGPSATSATTITRALCACPAITATSTGCRRAGRRHRRVRERLDRPAQPDRRFWSGRHAAGLRRQGLTRAALLEGMRRMKALGMDRVCVSTGETNTPARQLYESIGFKIVNKYLDFVQAGGAGTG